MISKNSTSKKSRRSLVGAVLVALFIFSICATTSPLYAFCDESHCFFSVGKAILNGQVLYKDILEQKGLLIYLIQIPAYLISHTTFLGVWLIQMFLVLTASIYVYKIIGMKIQQDFLCFSGTVLWALIIFTSSSLASAQIIEVYVLPLFCVSLYQLLQMLEEKVRCTYLSTFINGLFAGLILWSKYSLLGFYFAWGLVVCLWIWKNDNFLSAIRHGMTMLAGMMVITIPCLLYFICNHAVSDLVDFYLLSNVSSYGENITLFNLIKGYLNTILFEGRYSFFLALFLVIGGIYVVWGKWHIQTKIGVVVLVAVQYGLVFSHGPMFPYYFFAFAPFAVFGSLGIMEFLDIIISRWKTITFYRWTYIVIGVLSVAIALIVKPFPNQFLASRSGLAQYQFAEYMNSHYEKPTSLDYGFLDGGFYTVADIVPTTWAFCKLNVTLPRIDEDQLNSIMTKKTDFVVTRSDVTIPEQLLDNYVSIMQVSQYRVYTEYTYTLWEAK